MNLRKKNDTDWYRACVMCGPFERKGVDNQLITGAAVLQQYKIPGGPF